MISAFAFALLLQTYSPARSTVAYVRCTPAAIWLSYGDSKTAYNNWQPWLNVYVRQGGTSTCIAWGVATSTGMGFLARGGYSTATMKPTVDADLAAITATGVTHIMYNLGSVDSTAMPSEADFKTNMGYILDAFHTKWPNARVWAAKPWRRNYGANCDTLAGWIDAVVAARSGWAFVGHDERVWMEGGDDGATMTSDGVHPNDAGNAECAAQWKTTLGY